MSARCSLDCVGPLEPAVSRWPGRLYALVLALALLGIAVSGLMLTLKLLSGLLAAGVLVVEWRRQPQLVTLTFSPRHLQGQLRDGTAFRVEAPFHCAVQANWVSVEVPMLSAGWLTLYADQFDATHFRQLRRVLTLGRQHG